MVSTNSTGSMFDNEQEGIGTTNLIALAAVGIFTGGVLVGIGATAFVIWYRNKHIRAKKGIQLADTIELKDQEKAPVEFDTIDEKQ
jgi:hypothetical protein